MNEIPCSEILISQIRTLRLFVSNGVRKLTYTEVEKQVRNLAEMLLDRFGHKELQEFRYTAIPRGGFFVLGMLSYFLKVEHARLKNSSDSDRPIVVVDDCSLSGKRFADVLATTKNKQVIFVHLLSHPDLRAAIIAGEEQVVDVLSSGNLKDLAPDVYGDRYESWLTKCHDRTQDSRYWFGLHEPFSFPWSEPDLTYWNASREMYEDTWRFVAPNSCLRNWARLGLPVRSTQINWRLSQQVLYNLQVDRTTLCDLATDKVYNLHGVADKMWRAIVGYGDLTAAADYLLTQFDVSRADLSQDLKSFATKLQERGIIEFSNKCV